MAGYNGIKHMVSIGYKVYYIQWTMYMPDVCTERVGMRFS